MAHLEQNPRDEATGPGWLPVAALTALVLLSVVPMPVGHGPLPDIVLISVYLACARPNAAVSPGAVFCLGLLQDLLGSTPFGLHALVYVLVHAAATQAAGLGRSIVVQWLGFLPCAIVGGAASWAVISIHYTSLVSPDPILSQTFASILAFPLVALPIQWATGALRDES
jgi:rod shape-determining protein MreD